MRTRGPVGLLGTVLALAVLPAGAAEVDNATAPENADILVIGRRPRVDANPNADPDAPYKVDKSQNDKFTEKLRDTPKSVTAIPKEVIEDLGANSFREVVRSTPGVTLGTGEGGNAFGDRIFIRGFEARNDVYIDDLRDPGVVSREIFAVEQIEIVKGPSGNFGGRGTTGGLVSLESKRPHFGANFAVGETGAGSDGYVRETVDLNVSPSEHVAFRANGLYQNADTPGRDFVTSERYGAALAGAWKPVDALKFSADYYYFRLNGVPDYGHPFDVTTQRPFAVNRNNFYGVIGRDFIRNGADIGTARIDFEPSAALHFRSIGRVGRTYNRYLVGAPGRVCMFERTASGACPQTGVDVGVENYTVPAGAQRRWATNRAAENLTDVTARFSTGPIAHTLVFGGEYDKESVALLPLAIPPFIETGDGDVVSTSGIVRNLLNPDPVLGFFIPVAPDRTNGPSKVTVRTLAGYALDTIKLNRQFSLTLGGRYDDYDLQFRSSDLPTATQLANRSGFLNWQASLAYKPVEALTFYASSATSSNPSGEQIDGNGLAYDGIAPQTEDLSPERNKSYEAGAKWELAGGHLLATAAAYEIIKDNARENVGNGVFELAGRLRSRGFEAGLTGAVTDRLQIFGGYTYNDARIVSSTIVDNVGRRFSNIPLHSANLLATYLVTSRVEIGGQAHYQSTVFGGTLAAGSAHIPGYVRFDLIARWKPTDRLEARVNVNNLTNKTYYDAIYRSATPFAYVAPGRSGFVTLVLSY